MSEAKTFWLLDLTPVCGSVRAEELQRGLAAQPGVIRACVFPQVAQAEVVLASSGSVFPDDLAQYLRAAGYGVRASRLPDPSEDSVYARYYYSSVDSSGAFWVD